MAYTSLTRKQLDDTLVEDVNNASCMARVRFFKADPFLSSTLSTTLRASTKTRRDRNPFPRAKTSSRCSTTITHVIPTDTKMNASEFSKRF